MLKIVKYYLKKPYNAFRIFKLLYGEFCLLINHLGSSNYEKSKEKFKAKLIIESHIIEKGLSLKDVKVGFGVPRIIKLLKDLEFYFLRFKDQEVLFFVMSLIESYIKFNKDNGVENSEIILKYNAIKKYCCSFEKEYFSGGTKDVTRELIHKKASINYLDFVKSRYSIRNFTGEDVSKELILRALDIARYTPSACNRQPWGNYVIFNKGKIIELLDFQTGARQFKNDISCLILVTSSYNSFFGGELHQPYVNGGMYSMNLIFALHSMGLGTVPLNMGFEYSKLKQLEKYCEIKDNEVPILMIGVGIIPKELKVANSMRFNYSNYTKIYN